MDTSRFRRKVLQSLFVSPWSLIPVVLGLSLLIISWGFGSTMDLTAFVGICGLLGGVGAVATRWILSLDDISKRALKEIQDEAAFEREAALDELDRQLRQDEDERTEESLRALRELYGAFRKDTGWADGLGSKVAFEMATKVERLFQGCLDSLRRSLDLWRRAENMRTTKARDTILGNREKLIVEVEKSIEQLERTVDGVQALAVNRDGSEDLARIRRELDESLEVAKRVEERIRSMETEVGEAMTRRE